MKNKVHNNELTDLVTATKNKTKKGELTQDRSLIPFLTAATKKYPQNVPSDCFLCITRGQLDIRWLSRANDKLYYVKLLVTQTTENINHELITKEIKGKILQNLVKQLQNNQ